MSGMKNLTGIAAGLLAVVAGCGGLYVWGQRHLAYTYASNSSSGPSGGSTATASKTPSDVPQGVLQGIGSALEDVNGLDELVVERASGGGYDVSVTLNYKNTPKQQAVQDSMAAVLQDVYATKKQIKDVEVYALQTGQIIAGAGLGVDAYRKIAGVTGVSQFSLVSALEGSNHNTQGPDDKWFNFSLSASDG